MEHLNDEKCDICLVQETFLREAEKAILQQIRDYGWQILSNPRKHRTGGGIAILYRERFTLKSNDKVVNPGQYRKKYVIYLPETCHVFYHVEGHFFGRPSPEKFRFLASKVSLVTPITRNQKK